MAGGSWELRTGLAAPCSGAAADQPLSYKLVVKPLLQKKSLDPEVLAKSRPISTLPFISKVVEKVLESHLLDQLQRNNLFEIITAQKQHVLKSQMIFPELQIMDWCLC